MRLDICLCPNRNHLYFAMIVAYSAIINNKTHQLYIHIVHDNCITNQDISKFVSQKPLADLGNYHFILHNVQSHHNYPKINHTRDHWCKEVNFKLLLPSLLPDIKKILYLDTDTFINNDLRPLFTSQISNSKIFVADNLVNSLCGGIILINLDLARQHNIENTIISAINDDPHSHKTEEAAINNLFSSEIGFDQNNIFTLSKKRKRKESKQQIKSKSCFHLVGRKPWEMAPSNKWGVYSCNKWFDYLMQFTVNNKNSYLFWIRIYNVYIARILYSILKRILFVFGFGKNKSAIILKSFRKLSIKPIINVLNNCYQ